MNTTQQNLGNIGAPVLGIANLIATGNNQATAFPLAYQYNVFAIVPVGTGCRLPQAGGGPVTIWNQGLSALSIYPAADDLIVGGNLILTPGSSIRLVSLDTPLTPRPHLWYQEGGSNNNGGGSASLVAPAVTGNALLGSLPANSWLLRLLLRDANGVGANVGLGITLGGTEILGLQEVPDSGTFSLTVDITSFSIGSFAAGVTTPIFITSSGGGSSIKAQLDYEPGP